MLPLGADPAQGCVVLKASFFCTDDSEAHNTVSASAAGPPLLQPAAAVDTPSDAPTTPASHALVSTGSRLVPKF